MNKQAWRTVSETVFHITLKSSNVKTGPIPVSTTSGNTCPPSCPFLGSGCYAESGPLALHWRKVSAGDRGMNFAEFLEIVRNIPANTLWRHNQAGDLPGIGGNIDTAALEMLANSASHTNGFTYTHKPVLDGQASAEIVKHNRQAIKLANDLGFTVNLSADNASHADSLAQLNIAPVVTVLPENAASVSFTPNGRRIVVCPAQQRDNVSCATCGLCARQDRNEVIIGFLAHGTGKKKAGNIAAQVAA